MSDSAIQLGASIDTSTEKPRLLFVTTAAVTLRAFLLPYATYFRERGWSVHAASAAVADIPECGEAFDRVYELTWSRKLFDLGAMIRSLRRLRSIVATNSYDIVHVHTPIASFITRFALRRMRPKVKVVYTAHGFHFHEHGSRIKNGIYRSLEALAARWTDALIVINREDAQAARGFGTIDPRRVHYMPGIGIDVRQFSNEHVAIGDAARVRSDLNLTPTDHLILMIAEFNPGKRHVDVLRAMAAHGRENVHVAFAGAGPQLESVKLFASKLGLTERTHFLGFRKDIPCLLMASAMVVLPSEREGLPRSILEAMACRVPVVAYDIRGLRELLANGAGCCVRFGDWEALGRAMNAVLDDDRMRKAFVERASERVREYSIDKLTALHEDLYRSILDERNMDSSI
jgi:glycosyltransferase involved in cell wall biosynthesis